jgi:hypothetical protein
LSPSDVCDAASCDRASPVTAAFFLQLAAFFGRLVFYFSSYRANCGCPSNESMLTFWIE